MLFSWFCSFLRLSRPFGNQASEVTRGTRLPNSKPHRKKGNRLDFFAGLAVGFKAKGPEPTPLTPNTNFFSGHSWENRSVFQGKYFFLVEDQHDTLKKARVFLSGGYCLKLVCERLPLACFRCFVFFSPSNHCFWHGKVSCWGVLVGSLCNKAKFVATCCHHRFGQLSSMNASRQAGAWARFAPTWISPLALLGVEGLGLLVSPSCYLRCET